jgi:PAS domain S-box-containing protein
MKKQTVKKKLVKKKPVKKDNRNALIKSLRGKIKEQEEVLEKIQSFNKSLEKQVEERTEELLTINKQLGKEISKKTLAEKTLKEKNERLKYHIENSPLAVVEWDADYVVTQWSKEAERVFGYSACETLGKKIESLNLIYESDIPIVVKTMELLSCGKESTIVSSNRNITKSGNIIECVWYNSVLLDSEKNMNSVQSLVLDITEKKKDEDALLKSEEQYHSLFNMMLEGFCIIEVVFDKEQRPIDYRFLEINPVFEGQTGLHDAQGKLMRELAPDHEEHWFEIYGKVALTGEPIRFVNEAKALNRFYDVSAYRIGGKDSRKVAILFNDISENKKMEEMLRTTLQRFYLILSNLHAGILLVTDDDRVEFANQALCDSFNLIESPNDLLNLSANELINKIIISYNDPDEAVSRIKEIVSQRKSVSGEEVCMSNGRNFLRDFISINLGEKRYGRLWVNIDITDRKRAEAELIKLASFPLHNPNPVTELDFDGCIHYCNPAVYKLFPDLIRDGLNHPWLTHWQSIVEELNLDNSLRIIREVLVGDKYYLQTIHFVEETHHFRIYGTDITERKKAEYMLRESEERFRNIFELPKAVMLLIDPGSGEIVDANEAAANFYGWSRNQLQKMKIQDINILPSDEVERKREEAVGAKSNYFVFRHRLADGEIRWVEVYSSQIQIKEKPLLFSIIHDITERKKIEDILLKSESNIRGILDATQESIYLFDRDGKIVTANSTAAKRLGYNLEDIIGRTFSEFVTEELAASRQKQLDGVFNEGTPIQFEDVRNGLVFIHNFYPVTENDKVINVVSFSQDITQQRIMENQLRKLSRAVEQSPESIVITNTNGIIEYVNPKFEEITGYSPQEVKGKNPRILKSGHTPPEVYKDLWTNINNGKEWRGELYNKKKNGEFFWESISISPVKNSEGIVTNIVAIKEDITEKKNQVELLYRLNRTLKAMHDSNEAILLYDDESQFMNEVCKVIVEDCGHKLVWIGFAENNISKKVNPVAFYGKDKEYVEKLNITWDDSDHGNGPTGTAIKTGKVAICRNMFTSTDFEPWREEALKRGFESSIVFPFKINGEISGAITIYSSDQDPFSSEEINLLSELVNDLSYGIDILRLKKAKEKADIELRKHRDNLEVLVKIRSGELQSANEQLKSASIYMRTLLEASLDPLVTIDKTGVITDVNKATEIVTGLSRKELIGNNFSDYFTDPGKAKLGFNKVISKGFVRDFPLTISNISGKRTEVLYNATIYKNEAGEILGVFAAARDITEQRAAEIELNIYRKHLEELVKTRTIELASANKQLSEEIEKEKKVEILLKESLAKEKELNELKTRFLSTTSHEFRTPLTSILSSMQLVQKYRKKWSDEQVDEHFIKVKYSVQNLTKLLDDVLTLNRSESGKLTFSPGTLDLHKFTLDILKEVEHIRTEKHEIIFNYSLKRSEYILDAKLMNFIIMNLMTNAIKYSPNGGKVELNISHYGNQIQIIVSDEGIGIPKEEYDRLFEPFNRAKNTDNIPGTGLGLSIVKIAVQMYNGKIDFQSELGKGTKFIVIIPSENK